MICLLGNNKCIRKLKLFPIATAQIDITYRPLDEDLFDYQNHGKRTYSVDVSIKLHDAPEIVIDGGLAHELGHISSDLRLRRMEKLVDRLAREYSARYRWLEERNIDLNLLLRGLGPAYLEYLKYAEKNDWENLTDDGLSIEELRKLLKVK